MIQSMRNGKHTTSSQLWAGILCKDEWLKRKEKFFLEPHSWSVYTFKYEVTSDAGFFPLHWYCYVCYFCIYFSLGTCQVFLQSTEVRKCKVMAYVQRITHTKACRELYLCPQMHTVLALVFKSTQWFSFHFEWWNSIHCVLLAHRFNSPLHWPEGNHLQVS